MGNKTFLNIHEGHTVYNKEVRRVRSKHKDVLHPLLTGCCIWYISASQKDKP